MTKIQERIQMTKIGDVKVRCVTMDTRDYSQLSKYAEDHYTNAVFAYQDGKYIKAISELDSAIESNRHYAEAYSLRGHARYPLGQLIEALSDHQTARRHAMGGNCPPVKSDFINSVNRAIINLEKLLNIQ